VAADDVARPGRPGTTDRVHRDRGQLGGDDLTDLADVKARIRAELRADGATQADLARYLGVTQKHVSAVLTGKQAGSPEMLEAMAHAVGLRLTVGWEDV
jgi:ribosome-binding protein aMBF1 (putative translation factor)